MTPLGLSVWGRLLPLLLLLMLSVASGLMRSPLGVSSLRYPISSPIACSRGEEGSIVSASESHALPEPLASTTGAKSNFVAHNTPFCECTVCRAAYVLSEEDVGPEGRMVKCGLCGNAWRQTLQALLRTGPSMELADLSPAKIAETKRRLMRGPLSAPLVDAYEIFVGNIPPRVSEGKLLELFYQFGVISLTIAKDPVGRSKGFAFIKFANEEDANRAIKERSQHEIAPKRKLYVTKSEPLATRQTRKPRAP